MIKVAAPRMALKIVDDAIQVHGHSLRAGGATDYLSSGLVTEA